MDVFYLDNTWSMYLIDLNDYGLKNVKIYRFIIIVTDSFPKIASGVHSKTKFAQIFLDSFGNNLSSSKRKLNLFRTGDRKEFLNKLSLIFEGKKIRR